MAGFLKSVTIAGGGLAGLSLGIALRRRGVMTTLHEAGSYPRHRVCGEFVSGVTEGMLARLGIVRHFRDAVPLASARWFDAAGPVASLRVEAMGISRWLLDDRLQQDFQESGGSLRVNSRADPGGEIVWAAGREKTQGNWIGLKCHARGLALDKDLEMHLGRNGYVGLARIEGGLVNVCGLFRKQPGIGGKGALFQCLRAGGLDRVAERIGAAQMDAFCAVAGFHFGRQRGPEFSIGDSARMIPPFTGNGMAMAIESAACALDPLLEYAAGKLSWREAAECTARAQRLRFRRRMGAALLMQALLASVPGLVCALARQGCVPNQFLLSLVR
jgi:flavin-dependent dehydrogenase